MKPYTVHEVLSGTQKKLAEVKAERDALAAQVEALRDSSMFAWHNWRESLDVCGAMHELLKVTQATPQQHLAEVKAQAAEDAIQAVLNLHTFTAKNGDWLIKAIAWDKVLPFKKQYADSIRQEVK